MKRAEAIAAGLKRYMPDKPCSNGHISERLVKGPCVECHRLYAARYRSEHRELCREASKRHRESDPGRWSQTVKRYRAKNRERYLENCKAIDAKRKAAHAASERAREAKKLRATPSWVDKAALRRVYEECRDKVLRTGIRHQVDHIVPLRGKNVCGLHVPWNLRVIETAENQKKSNKLILEIAVAPHEFSAAA